MDDQLFVNEIIVWPTQSLNEIELTERVLWIDEGYAIAFVFNINADKGFPEIRNISDILEAFSNGTAYKQEYDPWARIIKDENLTERILQIRDKRWHTIKFIVEKEPEIYYRHLRGTLVKKLVENYNIGRNKNRITEKTVYGYLRKFWQRGKTINALLPDYENSAGKGKTKATGKKKRGRPRKYATEEEIGEGINITEEDRKTFRTAIALYYHTPKKNTLKTAYELMIQHFYQDQLLIDDNYGKSQLASGKAIPTLGQFKYWYKKEHSDWKKIVTSRYGSKEFNLNHRAISGNSTNQTIGPGSRYEIDATIGDFYLVSKFNRSEIIGRPVIYVAIDVFSRLIAGIYVGLEGPSWMGAMMALANTVTDKVQFCQGYGIEINEETWPCYHLPEILLADRGELKGKGVEPMIRNLKIRVENAAPYRADWKGIVERNFRTMQGYTKPFIPGDVDINSMKRGGRDYRLDAKLDLHQMTKIIIQLVREHNTKYLENYNRDEELIADEIAPIPVDLWQWGIANRSGKLRTFPEDIVKLNLMPTEEATITARGIKLKGKEMYYTCERAEIEQWFSRARSNQLSKAEKKLEVSYDPRKSEFIYIPSQDGRSFEKCRIIDPDGKYLGKTFEDIEYLAQYEARQTQKHQAQSLHGKIEAAEEIEKVVEQAETMTSAQSDENLSKRQRISGIRENRASEKAKQRDNEGFVLGEEQETSNSSNQSSSEESKVSKPRRGPNYLDHLKRNKRREKS